MQWTIPIERVAPRAPCRDEVHEHIRSKGDKDPPIDVRFFAEEADHAIAMPDERDEGYGTYSRDGEYGKCDGERNNEHAGGPLPVFS